MSTGTRVQVYEPYSYALPKLGTYLRDLWQRRRFADSMARSTMKARHYNTVFGQLWLLINPLLLGAVYFLLVMVLGSSPAGMDAGKHFVFILGGLFAYYYTRNVIQFASTSITGSGKIILNIPFPKALLPISSLVSSVRMYWPMLLLYAIAHVMVGYPVGWTLLWTVPIFLIQTVFSLGVGLIFATMNVYFRDASSFLPYVLRIWIYISPVLFSYQHLRGLVTEKHWDRDWPVVLWILDLNPLTPILGAWQQAVNEGIQPDGWLLIQGTCWAIGALLVGGWYFLSREREFAVRI